MVDDAGTSMISSSSMAIQHPGDGVDAQVLQAISPQGEIAQLLLQNSSQDVKRTSTSFSNTFSLPAQPLQQKDTTVPAKYQSEVAQGQGIFKATKPHATDAAVANASREASL